MTKISSFHQPYRNIQFMDAGHKHIVWDLRPDVNVLSGRNGAGKKHHTQQTHSAFAHSSHHGRNCRWHPLGVKIDFSPSDATSIRYDVMRSFDRKIIAAEPIGGIKDVRIVTELDWQLYLVQRRYLDYQVNVGNRMIALLTSGDPRCPRKGYANGQFKDTLPRHCRRTVFRNRQTHQSAEQ